ncbi:addiction module antitoxin, RelB/DinJ family [Fannyhessea vaginae]|nr:addiction module antitoxin, RelB/DinJ family [Fannyhessea vaginae]
MAHIEYVAQQIEISSVYRLTTYTVRIIVVLKGADTMATSPTQIRIDSTVKTDANELFSKLGIDMSSAVNIFLRQCILRGGLPFKVEVPKYNAETLAAMAEARDIMSGKIQATSYNSTDELLKALNAED